MHARKSRFRRKMLLEQLAREAEALEHDNRTLKHRLEMQLGPQHPGLIEQPRPVPVEQVLPVGPARRA